jgi:hypothetical protein
VRRFNEMLLRRFQAASGVDADIDNYRTAFHVFNHGFSNNNWSVLHSHRSMATSQRLNAFSNDLDMVEVKCVGSNCFVDGAVL